MVTAATVTLGPAGAFNNIWKADITDAIDGAQCDQIINPGSNTLSFINCTISVTTAVTTFKVRIIPKTHANMPAVPSGLSYDVTGTITSFTSTNAQAGTDTDSATVTIDNLSPGNVTGPGAAPGDTQVTLSWTNPVDADFNNVVILRNTATIGDVPTEGSSPLVNDTIPPGNSVVRYTGSISPFVDTGLTNGQIYYYRIFAKDDKGNYSDTGVEVSATPDSFSAAVTGTITPSAIESEIVSGGKTIVITLTNDTWVPGGGGFPQVQSVTETSFAPDTLSHLVQMPATVDPGDLLVILISLDKDPPSATPGGWTQLFFLKQDADEFAGFAKDAVGDEDGTTVDVTTAVVASGAAQVYRITNWEAR